MGFPILPVGITGTFDPIFFGQLKRFRRPRAVVRIGPVFTLPPIPSEGRDEMLQKSTDEIMCRIAALMPREYRGIYSEHARLKELLKDPGRPG
jgi:1-acyl-sn-glycerol-3-phosphate acyltransferase